MKLIPEWYEHQYCLIAWPCNKDLYGKIINKARDEVANVINEIAKTEHVIVLSNEEDINENQENSDAEETSENENRVAITPESAKFLIKLGHEVIIQSGAGDRARFSDKDYKASGCKILKSSSGIFKEAEVVAKVNAPSKIELSKLQKKQILNQTLLDLIH